MRVLLSWSSGKDSAWCLHRLRRTPGVEVIGLLTTLNQAADRVAMHAVRRELLRAQAQAAGLPLTEIELPWPCSNDDYERIMAGATRQAKEQGVTHIAFGDLFLEDVRAYRERNLEGTGIAPLFPLWGSDTRALADEMIAAGQRAVITCVDPKQLDPAWAGRQWHELVAELGGTEGVDPCGERGEFHTFVYASPEFGEKLQVTVREIVTRDGFCFADLLTHP